MITYSDIQKIRQNEYYLNCLKEKRNIVPFVGAGISSCCYPMWGEFLRGFILKDDERKELEDYLQKGEYEEAASYVQKCTQGLFTDTVKRTFNASHMEVSHFYSSLLVIPRLASNLCITTNLDTMLEKAYELCKKEIKVITPDMQDQINDAIGTNCNYLVKLHGSYEESSKYVLTKEQYDKAYGIDSSKSIDFNNPFVNALSRLMISRTLLFLGCSLQNDRTLHVLRQIMQKYNDHIQHYALLEMLEKDDEMIDRERKLADFGIRVIWYPIKQYDSIEVIIRELLINSSISVKSHNTLPKNINLLLGRDQELETIKKK